MGKWRGRRGGAPDRAGFTLMEISIVIVIIGLLIGGILTGQNLMDSAKINKQIQQIERIRIAVTQFKSKFSSLPGDSAAIGVTGYAVSGQPAKVCAGNGNGQINNGIVLPLDSSPEWLAANGNSCDESRTEHMRVFEHLGVTGMYPWAQYDDGDETNFQPAIAYPRMILDSYAPKSLGNPGGIVIGWEGALSYMREGNKIRLGACPGLSSGPTAGGALPGAMHTSFYCGPSLAAMMALDAKMDDGKPMSGNTVVTSNYYIYRIKDGLDYDATACCINSSDNSYKSEPIGSGIGNGGYIALELNTDF